MSVLVEVSEASKAIKQFNQSKSNSKDKYKARDIIEQNATFGSSTPSKNGKQFTAWPQINGLNYRAKGCNIEFDKLTITRNSQPYMEEGQEHSIDSKTNHMWLPAGDDTQVGIIGNMIDSGLTSESTYASITEPVRQENKKLKNEQWTFNPVIKRKEITTTPEDGIEYLTEMKYKSPAIKVDIPIDDNCHTKWLVIELRQKVGEDSNGKSQYEMRTLQNVHISELLELLQMNAIIKPTVSFYKVWVGVSKLNGKLQYGIKCSLSKIIIYNENIVGDETKEEDDDDEIIVNSSSSVEETKEDSSETETKEEEDEEDEESEEEEDDEEEESEDDD